jgi:hypothetical protein
MRWSLEEATTKFRGQQTMPGAATVAVSESSSAGVVDYAANVVAGFHSPAAVAAIPGVFMMS